MYGKLYLLRVDHSRMQYGPKSIMSTNHCVFHKFGELFYQIHDFLTSLDKPFDLFFPVALQWLRNIDIGKYNQMRQ